MVEIEGTVARREPGQINRDLPTGEVEVDRRARRVLSRSETPPFALDGKDEAAEETRLRYRYLDLRRPELQQNFVLRAPGDARGPQLLRRARLPRGRDADPHQVHAGGRARLPGARRASTTAASTPCRSRRSSSSSS